MGILNFGRLCNSGQLHGSDKKQDSLLSLRVKPWRCKVDRFKLTLFYNLITPNCGTKGFM